MLQVMQWLNCGSSKCCAGGFGDASRGVGGIPAPIEEHALLDVRGSDEERGGHDAGLKQPSAAPRSALRAGAATCLCHTAIGCSIFWVFLFLVGLASGGWATIWLQMNSQNQQDPNITPDNFPRNNSCVSCPEGVKTNDELRKCLAPCVNPQLVFDWADFSGEVPYKHVYFRSRKGPRGEEPVNISAWWLPPRATKGFDPAKAPRVVALHGAGANYNHCGAQMMCFHLRSMGIGCLVPTVRDFGHSAASAHPNSVLWGYDQAMDILGGWDFAVNDPDGVLGGPIPPEHVGVMGFSKGALEAAVAFFLEPRIGGVWLDSGPYNGFLPIMQLWGEKMLGWFVTTVLKYPLHFFSWVESFGKQDYYVPTKLVEQTCAAPKRNIFLSHGVFDTSVPLADTLDFARLLKQHPDCYTPTVYLQKAYCNGQDHHQEMWEFPDDTRAKLCKFWTTTFGISASTCGLDKLPHYQLWNESNYPPGTPTTDINIEL